jgi:hypothetical protein
MTATAAETDKKGERTTTIITLNELNVNNKKIEGRGAQTRFVD